MGWIDVPLSAISSEATRPQRLKAVDLRVEHLVSAGRPSAPRTAVRTSRAVGLMVLANTALIWTICQVLSKFCDGERDGRGDRTW